MVLPDGLVFVEKEKMDGMEETDERMGINWWVKGPDIDRIQEGKYGQAERENHRWNHTCENIHRLAYYSKIGWVNLERVVGDTVQTVNIR